MVIRIKMQETSYWDCEGEKMNGKKCKRIRKEVYGDMSQHTRKYVRNEKGTVLNHQDGLRAKYLRLKRWEKGK